MLWRGANRRLSLNGHSPGSQPLRAISVLQLTVYLDTMFPRVTWGCTLMARFTLQWLASGALGAVLTAISVSSSVHAEDAPKKPPAAKVKVVPARDGAEGGFSAERIRKVIASARVEQEADPIITGGSLNGVATGSVATGPLKRTAVPAEGLPSDFRATVPPVRSLSEEPVFGPGAYRRILAAHARYEALEAKGGWPETPGAVMTLRVGSTHPLVLTLRQRLVISGDLDKSEAEIPAFDAGLTKAIRKFQSRHGLTQTGRVGKLTLRALNVPITTRINQLAASAHRLYGNGFPFADRYVVVNIPGATVEAVEGGFVALRNAAVVGRPDRPSPVIQAKISSVNLNPTWTAPDTVVKNDIADKILANPGFLSENRMRLVDFKGNPVDAAAIDWKALKKRKTVPFLLKQEPGPLNALGQIKIDMPNTLAVYMHDTPKKELFRSDMRFHSSGCARVEAVEDLASWLLLPQGIDMEELKARVSFGDTSQVRLKKHVPVAWVYLTGWGAADGTVQFRDDIYGLDTYEGIEKTTLRNRKAAIPVEASTPTPGSR
jgi:L,D-transpeptidase YcbB